MNNAAVRPAAMAAVLLTVLACGGTAARATTYESEEPIVTFTTNGCTYDGPRQLPASQFSFRWVIEDTTHPLFVIGIGQLDNGKSVQDLARLPSNIADAQVPWIKNLDGETIAQDEPHSKLVTWDLTQDADFKPGPVYFTCWYWEQRGGGLGPIEAVP